MINHYQEDNDIGAKVAHFFEAMNMPAPNSDEYEFSCDDGFLIFLDEPACVMRGSNITRCPPIRHDHVLQPLLSRTVSKNFRIEVFPGIVTPIKNDDVETLMETLREDGISFFDAAPFNAGYIPVSNAQFPDGVPVVIDMGCLRKLNSSTSYIRKLMEAATKRKAYDPPLQKSVFSNIYKAFAQAWPRNDPKPDQTLLSKAWDLCTKKKEEHVTLLSGRRQNILTADWQNMGQEGKMGSNYKNAKHGGERYAKRWDF